jgi:hypothetical protein
MFVMPQMAMPMGSMPVTTGYPQMAVQYPYGFGMMPMMFQNQQFAAAFPPQATPRPTIVKQEPVKKEPVAKTKVKEETAPTLATETAPPRGVKLERVQVKKERDADTFLEWAALDGDEDILQVRPKKIPVISVDSDEEEVFQEGQQYTLLRAQPKAMPKSKTSVGDAKPVVVHIYSIGWYQQGCHYSRDFQSLCQQIQDRMRVRFSRLPEMSCFIDTRMFFMKPFSGHCGMYGPDIQGFVGHPHFKDWLQQTRALLVEIELELTDDKEIHLCFLCKAGHNRSVTAATILHSILRAEAYDVRSTHLSKPGWAHRRTCSTCDGCLKMSSIKMEAFAEALRIWKVVRD